MKNIIQYIRRKKNIKQNDLARALRVSASYLCKVENCLQKPTEKFIRACSRYLDIPREELFSKEIEKGKMENLNSSFKNRIWSVRQEKGIKQNELAKLLGCSPSYLSKVEKGLFYPNEQFRRKCARILKIKTADLFPG